jgi:DNA-binding NtrC family response regulator
MEVLLQYRWPGNIRELENAIERACVASRDECVRRENLPDGNNAGGKPYRYYVCIGSPGPRPTRHSSLGTAFAL